VGNLTLTPQNMYIEDGATLQEVVVSLISDDKCAINEHLGILTQYAQEVDHITEFGVERGNSTAAFLLGQPKVLRSYDIVPLACEEDLGKLKGETDFKFIQKDVLKVDIDRTDLLFIDTYHDFSQLYAELFSHAFKVNKYILLHDTESFGMRGQHESDGLLPAIAKFLLYNTEWRVKTHYKNCNGLSVLERTDA